MGSEEGPSHTGLPRPIPATLRRWLLPVGVAIEALGGACDTDVPRANAERADPSTLPAPAGPLRVATYNVQNLFDPAPNDGGDVLGEASETPTEDAYATKLAGLAEVIALVAADVLVLQEVENRVTLTDLAAAVSPWIEYRYQATYDGNDPRGIDLAVLSTVPIARILRHRHDVFRVLTATCDPGSAPEDPACWNYHFARDCLEIHLVVRGQSLVLLGVHLKAREDGEVSDDTKRLAEAQHTRRIAERLVAEDPERPLVILGDLNAWPGEPAVRAVLGDPSACACAGPRFSSAGATLPPEEAHSAFCRDLGREALYDDLILSPAATFRLLPGSVTLVHDEGLSVTAAKASDHDPIAVSLSIGRP